MSDDTKKYARDIEVQIYNRAPNVRTGSGAFVSAVQITKSEKSPGKKTAAKKSRARKA